MTEESPLVIEELGTFQLPAVALFDPEDLNNLIFHGEKGYPDYPPLVYCPAFRDIAPKTVDTPEKMVTLQRISLPEDSPEKASITPSDLLPDIHFCFLSPAHILPLARCIIDNERRKRTNAIQSQQRYAIPWNGGKQHTLFYTFIVNKHFTLNLVEVEFNWYDAILPNDCDTFGLGISCLDPGDGYGELTLASYSQEHTT